MSAQLPDYTYCSLKEASGVVNVIAVVKYFRNPTKTKGSGYSLFVSITDPSLCGSKLKCVIFNDSLEKLPQIQGVGDVILMHRLIVNEFRGDRQGCGYGTKGFAAAVFSSSINDPLVPRPSPTACSFTDIQLEAVQKLRQWFGSPACPVERELDVGEDNAEMPSFLSSVRSGVTRLASLAADRFTCIEGQVVSIYRYRIDDRCTIVYLWDGPLTEEHHEERSHPQLMNKAFTCPLPAQHRLTLLTSAVHDPLLGAITGHGLTEDVTCSKNGLPAITCALPSCVPDDWSVPVFIYDEHAISEPVRSLAPGDIVRVNNIHVMRCKQLDCRRTGCLRVVVHGDGLKHGRGVQLLLSKNEFEQRYQDVVNAHVDSAEFVHADEVNKYGLIDSLLKGFARRRPVFKTIYSDCIDQYRALCPLLSFDQVGWLPDALGLEEANALGISLPPTEQCQLLQRGLPAPSSWLTLSSNRLTQNPLDSSRLSSVCVRLVGRIVQVTPQTADELGDALILSCLQCGSAIRLSCLRDVGKCGLCRCNPPKKKRRADGPDSGFIIYPVFFFRLEDATGSLVVCATGHNVITMLNYQGTAPLTMDWEKLVVDVLNHDPSSPSPFVNSVLTRLRTLSGHWVDIACRVSWREPWDLPCSWTGDNSLCPPLHCEML